MRLFRVPYRWMPRTFWRNIRWITTDITGGIANVFRWVPVIWFDDDGDWQKLAEIMRYKLLQMATAELTSYHLTAMRDRKQKLICAELLKRLIADDYFSNAGYDAETWESIASVRQTWMAKHSEKQAKQDQEYLGKMIGKYLRNWWT